MPDEPLLVRREDAVAVLAINDAPCNRVSLDGMDAPGDRQSRYAESR